MYMRFFTVSFVDTTVKQVSWQLDIFIIIFFKRTMNPFTYGRKSLLWVHKLLPVIHWINSF